MKPQGVFRQTGCRELKQEQEKGRGAPVRYRVCSEWRDGREHVILSDDRTGSEAFIIPGIGCNLIRCRLEGHETIEGPPHLSMLAEYSAEYGVPLLWPPSRIAGGTFAFRGRRYTFPQHEGGHHLHGDIRHLPWEVVSLSASETEGAWMTAELRATDHPGWYAYYPHEVALRLTYRLKEGRISAVLDAVNEGRDEAPYGFGIHPYFTLSGDALEETEVAVPAEFQYDTSELVGIGRLPERTVLCRQLDGGLTVSALPAELDHVLLRLVPGKRECRLTRRRSGIRIVFGFSENLAHAVVFVPEWAHAVSLEPWSSITDAFNSPLPAEWTGLSGLEGGQAVRFEWQWHVERLGQ
ncbi:aldose 1-epimerase [Paenibacillus ehimensis]|uniref:aldose 1-epimerase n=1 Tax=Paenibacillus ehimensis TaxID=79264 RepID=UPI000471FFC7|nr:aldose 1-epimerase [Paenibacillus ehimensis]